MVGAVSAKCQRRLAKPSCWPRAAAFGGVCPDRRSRPCRDPVGEATTRDFKVFLEPDEDYGGYVVVCPSIPGCHSQGKTVPEALANIRETIDLCIEDMESRGEEIPDPNNVLIGSVVVTR